MATVNVLVLIHGMTLETVASTHSPEYDVLWNGLKSREPLLAQKVDKIVQVEWGHKLVGSPPNAPADDELTTDAENTILQASSYDQVRSDPSGDNHPDPTPPWDLPTHAARRITKPLKETILTLGFTDAVFYCSPDGERAVRKAVYSRVLSQLESYRGATEVRLHVIAASLGATVAFDFLYGLIAPGVVPDFVGEQQGDATDRERFNFWRERAQQQPPTLVLGSKTTTGAQIPLMMMRSKQVVRMLAQGQRLDPTVIGVPRSGAPKWRIFYDVDDILGFPTRRLFDARGTIQEYEVNTGLMPTDAHGRYWTNASVLAKITELIRQNL